MQRRRPRAASRSWRLNSRPLCFTYTVVGSDAISIPSAAFLAASFLRSEFPVTSTQATASTALPDQAARSSSRASAGALSAFSEQGEPVDIEPAQLLFATSRSTGVALFYVGGRATASISLIDLHARYPALLMPISPDCLAARGRMLAVRSLIDNFGERHRYLLLDGHPKPLLVRRDYFEAVVHTLDRVEPRSTN